MTDRQPPVNSVSIPLFALRLGMQLLASPLGGREGERDCGLTRLNLMLPFFVGRKSREISWGFGGLGLGWVRGGIQRFHHKSIRDMADGRCVNSMGHLAAF